MFPLYIFGTVSLDAAARVTLFSEVEDTSAGGCWLEAASCLFLLGGINVNHRTLAAKGIKRVAESVLVGALG